jgi:hypothetical protein
VFQQTYKSYKKKFSEVQKIDKIFVFILKTLDSGATAQRFQRHDENKHS